MDGKRFIRETWCIFIMKDGICDGSRKKKEKIINHAGPVPTGTRPAVFRVERTGDAIDFCKFGRLDAVLPQLFCGDVRFR